jgi:hypothetical protein
MMRRLILGMLAVGFVAAGPISCKSSKSPKKKGSGDATPYPTGGYTPAPGQNIEITVAGTGVQGNQMLVKQGVLHTWNFSARSLDGSAAPQVTSLVPSVTPTGMTVSTNTISFTPSSTTDMSGSVTATAGTATQSFSWSADPNASTSASCTMAIVAQVVAAFTNKTAPTLAELIALFPQCKDSIANIIAGIKK